MKKIIIFLCFIIISVLLLAFKDNYAYANSSASAWNYFLKGDYKEAIEQASQAEGFYPHYIMGLSYLKLGKPAHARKHFNFINDVYPNAPIKEQASLGIADTYFNESNFETAASEYRKFLNTYPASGLNSTVNLRMGQSLRRLGNWTDARESLDRVLHKYPYSFDKQEALSELSKEFYYFVQVASFSRKINANRSYRSLKNKGFDVYIKQVQKDNKTFYRVCAGKFPTKKEAELVSYKLSKQGYEGKIYP